MLTQEYYCNNVVSSIEEHLMKNRESKGKPKCGKNTKTDVKDENYIKSSSSTTAQKSKPLRPNRVCLQHKYHDRADDPMCKQQHCAAVVNAQEIINDARAAADIDIKIRRGPRGGVIEPFPVKLHQMLSHVETENFSDVISWQPHGRCFVIHDPKRFINDIMPRHFKQSKLTSFQRQLNLYGFCRLTLGMDRGGYYHELFLRGRPDLCKRMIRQRVKGTGTKASYSSESEPNFYSMKPCWERTLSSKTNQQAVISSTIESNPTQFFSSITDCSLDHSSNVRPTKSMPPQNDAFPASSSLKDMISPVSMKKVTDSSRPHKISGSDAFHQPSLVCMAQSIASSGAVNAPLSCPPKLASFDEAMSNYNNKETSVTAIGSSNSTHTSMLSQSIPSNTKGMAKNYNDANPVTWHDITQLPKKPSLPTACPLFEPNTSNQEDETFFEKLTFHYLGMLDLGFTAV